MKNLRSEQVTSVRHWNDSLFSFTTTRHPGVRFENGQFLMLGLPVDGKPLMRAYSVASANWEEQLEFFSIKVPDGPLTSRLQHLQIGDEILLSSKPTGTLLIDDLHPGKRLYLFATGTGLAPFLSIIKDPDTYERFDRVVLTHGVRQVSDLAYHDYITRQLPQHELLGDIIARQLVYYPTVTREPFRNEGRLTELAETGRLTSALGLPDLDPADDRAMICGSTAMLADFRGLLDSRGFQVSARIGAPGDYVYERAFVDS
jgi:ferredoxin--NADP+ reductase